ncbi:MAG: diguanylate cyclase [Polyangiaceae bacterium]
MRRCRLSLSTRLSLIAGLLLCALFAVLGAAFHVLGKVETTAAELSILREAQRRTQQADMAHDAIRNAVLNLLLDVDGGPTQATRLRSLHDESTSLANEMALTTVMPLSPELHATVTKTQQVITGYIEQSERIGWLVTVNHAGALAELPDLDRAFEGAKEALGEQTDRLAEASARASADRARAGDGAKRVLLIAGALASLVSVALVVLITRSIRRSLRRVRDVAQAVASGALEQRVEVIDEDEIGALATSVNRMADHLQSTIQRIQQDVERSAFTAELMDALEMVDSEPEVHDVVTRAMAAVSPDHPMELLLADSSKAHLERAAQHPRRGAPGCPVGSPFGCAAVRRGNPVVFRESEALNACPHLRGRSCGAGSAVCVPVTFMGRSLGVLHASGPEGGGLSEAQQIRLRTIGIQAGARIGTLRAFQRTQLQASTDGLTGLSNRRAMEEALRASQPTSQPFAVVLGDLDHFKRLNDEHGHSAGDDALRIFAEVLRAALPFGDLAARWGGEEFAILLFDADAERALAWAELVRERLAEALTKACAPAFTASFGVADSTMSRELSALVKMADVALYQAKERGRNCAVVADSMARSGERVRARSEQQAAVDPRMLSDAGNRRATRSHRTATQWIAAASDDPT